MESATEFEFDVFLSHSTKDRAVVQALAERLRSDGLRVWFGAWQIKSGEDPSARIEEGLERSRVLVLCTSAQALGPEWTQLEAGTFRFRDPLNKERRFVLMRLDGAPIKGSLAHLLYISCLPEEHERAYAKLLESCVLPKKSKAEDRAAVSEESAALNVELDLKRTSRIRSYGFSPGGRHVLVGLASEIMVFDARTGDRLRTIAGDFGEVRSLLCDAELRRGLSGSSDGAVSLWDLQSGVPLRVVGRHSAAVLSLAWLPSRRRAVSGADDGDNSLRVWNVDTGRCLQVLSGHTGPVWSVAWSVDQRQILSGSGDMTMRLWDVTTGQCVRIFEGHTDRVFSVALSEDRRFGLSGSADGTIRLWDIETGHCLKIFEGHTDGIRSIAWAANEQKILSASWDHTVRLWDRQTGSCLCIFGGHNGQVRTVHWLPDENRAVSGDQNGEIRFWDMPGLDQDDEEPKAPDPTPSADYIQYTNAKVLLVGDSGAGKTGLSKVLAGEEWGPSDSTIGAWATQWKLPVSPADDVEREIWLWDFGGQADQRLIHQLYMDDTALAVLVFDGQKEDLFETLGQWDRDLTRASHKVFSKLLVAGRVDAGGLRMGRTQIESFAARRGFSRFLETSAKAGQGCEELKQNICDDIKWENIPWRSSPMLFKRLKDEIIRLKDEGRVLMRFNELREAIQLRMSGEGAIFSTDELKAVIGLLAGPGVVWELKFGNWVLMQPERINAYAQAVIQTMQNDEYERGCISVERVLSGDLTYRSSIERLGPDEERFVLLAMHQMLVERGLCLREQTENGPLLIFPSYYRRERPELIEHPAVVVTYRFNGFLDDIYATLVIRLHHTLAFRQDHLWRYAADFKTLVGKQLGVKLTRRAEGAGELEVYFDPTIPMEEKIIFSKYVHEHLLQNATDVVRLRHYVCPHCGTGVESRDAAMRRLTEGKKDILCVSCDDPNKRVPLWDEMEELFASEKVKKQVRELQQESAIFLDSESKERALVGEVISTVALAGQICREKNVSDHGIDMEIEFKSEDNEATGRMLFLQLKSGDSYLRKRKSDGAEIFRIDKARHAKYWREQAFPVLLVVRNSQGEVRWMDIRSYLRRANDNGGKAVKDIVFQGERFDVMSVRRWRDKSFSQALQ